jgi:hypothetical protein
MEIKFRIIEKFIGIEKKYVVEQLEDIYSQPWIGKNRLIGSKWVECGKVYQFSETGSAIIATVYNTQEEAMDYIKKRKLIKPAVVVYSD